MHDSPRIRQHIDIALQVVNGEPGQPATFDRMHELLEEQAYRLAYWRTAIHEINYRRFFDIKELAGLRMEEPDVFAATHALILQLIRAGKVTGLRLDHLTDCLTQRAISSDCSRVQQSRSRGTVGTATLRCDRKDSLRQRMCLPAGRSRHDRLQFLNDLNRLFVDPHSATAMRRFTNGSPVQPLRRHGLRMQADHRDGPAGELNVLAMPWIGLRGIAGLATLLRQREAIARSSCFPVYRTYVRGTAPKPIDS